MPKIGLVIALAAASAFLQIAAAAAAASVVLQTDAVSPHPSSMEPVEVSTMKLIRHEKKQKRHEEPKAKPFQSKVNQHSAPGLPPLEKLAKPRCWNTAPLMEGTKSFRIEEGAHPSRWGPIFAFYHFTVDWAAPMLYFTKDAGPQVAIHAPCIVREGSPVWGLQGRVFELDSQAPRNPGSKAVWDRMFAHRKQNVTIVLEHEPVASIPVLDWHLQRDHQEWSMMNPEIYDYYRKFWWDMVKPDLSNNARVLIIKRGTDTERRTQTEKKFESGLEAAIGVLDNAKMKYDIVNMADKTQEEQVKLAAEASVIIGIHGAALSNAIFARPNTVLVEMGHRPWPCFKNLAHQAGLKYMHHEDASTLKSAIGAVLNQDETISSSLTTRQRA